MSYLSTLLKVLALNFYLLIQHSSFNRSLSILNSKNDFKGLIKI